MLRNTKDVENYAIGATDGEIGHQVLIAPPYDSIAELNREPEPGLYQHYRHPAYWTDAPVTPECCGHRQAIRWRRPTGASCLMTEAPGDTRGDRGHGRYG